MMIDNKAGRTVRSNSIASSRVLERMLGSQMYDVTKYHLRHIYHIRLDDFSQNRLDLEKLRIALYALVGEGGAGLIMQAIYTELERLKSK